MAKSSSKTAEGRLTNEVRVREGAPKPPSSAPDAPAAGAHAADHLINEEATPGSGALPGSEHAAGKDVDGGAG